MTTSNILSGHYGRMAKPGTSLKLVNTNTRMKHGGVKQPRVMGVPNNEFVYVTELISF